MNILIVGNVLKDVYLSLDARTEAFETDKNGTKWLDFGFNTSEHHFFRRNSTFGGAAISLEVLQKMGLSAEISATTFNYSDEPPSNSFSSEYRYILTSDDSVSYLVPTTPVTTAFATPAVAPDYIFIDRSAHLTPDAVSAIKSYLDANMGTALVVYLKSLASPSLAELVPSANLVFVEDHPTRKSAISPAPVLDLTEVSTKTTKSAPSNHHSLDLDPSKLIYLSETAITYKNITEPISIDRIDKMTHLSAFSLISATILGSFILGKTVEQSLKMARINVENSTLDSTLSLKDLEGISTAASSDLELIASALLAPGKGILAADESGGSIKKKFAALDIPDTAENRHDYRNIFFTTPDIEEYLSGVILFDETARDFADTGERLPDYLVSHRIIPGIKVDQGLAPLKYPSTTAAKGQGVPQSTADQNTNIPPETYTKGLDDLAERLAEYHKMGLRFAKWRAAFNLTLNDHNKIITPTTHAITENCRILAKYARTCQKAGLVPIVEPEVVYDGNYSITKCAEVTGRILDALIASLKAEKVNLRACIIKCNMVLAGKQYREKSKPEEVGRATAEVLKRHLPRELAGVVFLSGGQTPEQATANLKAILSCGPFPWGVTFSFARALQDPALYAWQGDNANTPTARAAFHDRLLENIKALGV